MTLHTKTELYACPECGSSDNIGCEANVYWISDGQGSGYWRVIDGFETPGELFCMACNHEGDEGGFTNDAPETDLIHLTAIVLAGIASLYL